MNSFSNVRIVGTGLIGTSIGLALAQHGISLSLKDSDEKALHLASDLLRGSLSDEAPELTIIAAPPQSVFEALKTEYEANPQSWFIDISSVKNKLKVEIELLPEIAKRFIGTHPMAGRESSGAKSAQADLFQGRAWILTPNKYTEPQAQDMAMQLIELLGATPYVMDSAEHDEVMAQISHTPQVISTLLAASLLDENFDSNSGAQLAGQGLRDMTRLAGSDGGLWAEILLENNASVLKSLAGFQTRLEMFQKALINKDLTGIQEVFQAGNLGRSQISGKHGAKPRNYSYLLIVIKDEPGALSELFNECAKLQANIEDLSIEHSPGQLTGLITLAFSPEDAQKVSEHLISKDWKVHQR
ncbi:MAG: hypothetical protein RLY76_911 [Actinomycetota bacterium]|jgi:prephenate dehydrogenase